MQSHRFRNVRFEDISTWEYTHVSYLYYKDKNPLLSFFYMEEMENVSFEDSYIHHLQITNLPEARDITFTNVQLARFDELSNINAKNIQFIRTSYLPSPDLQKYLPKIQNCLFSNAEFQKSHELEDFFQMQPEIEIYKKDEILFLLSFFPLPNQETPTRIFLSSLKKYLENILKEFKVYVTDATNNKINLNIESINNTHQHIDGKMIINLIADFVNTKKTETPHIFSRRQNLTP